MIEVTVDGYNPYTKNEIDQLTLDDLLDIKIPHHIDTTDTKNLTEIEKKARNLAKKYRNIHKYSEAINIYNKYMEFIIDKYGRNIIELLKKNMKHHGSGQIYIPTKPKFVKRKKGKSYFESIFKSKMTDEHIGYAHEYINNRLQGLDENDKSTSFNIKESDTIRTKDLTDKHGKINSVNAYAANNTSLEIMSRFIYGNRNSKNNPKVKDVVHIQNNRSDNVRDLEDLQEIFFNPDYIPKYVREEEEQRRLEEIRLQSQYVNRGNTWMTVGDSEEYNMLKQLEKLGWRASDRIVNMGGNIKKRTAFKALKKEKKRNKKNSKTKTDVYNVLTNGESFDSYDDFAKYIMGE